MVTGLKKNAKLTAITFDEANPEINVRTYNTDLKKRLLKFSKDHTSECELLYQSEDGLLEFEVNKGRLSFRLTAPYSDERKQILSRNAIQNNHLPKKK